MPLKIYKASAGSGKTFTIVKEYLKIVLKNPFDYKSILAITFTNKATQEMKERILSALEELSIGNSEMLESIINETGLEKEKIVKNAQKTLELILHDYSRFEVSTIDSFFAKVIRAFSKELQLPMRYEMEMNKEFAVEEAIKFMFSNLGENPQLLRWLLFFAYTKMDNDSGWNLDNALQELGKTIFEEDVFDWLNNFEFDYIELEKSINQAKKGIKQFEQELLDYSKQFEQLLKQTSLVAKDLVSGSTTWILTNVRKRYFDKTTKAFLDILNGDKNWYAKTSKKKEIIQSIETKLTLIAQNAYNFYTENLHNLNTQKAFLKHIHAYGVLGNIDAGVKAYRNDKNLLLISDVGAIITSAISDGDAPFIYEKIGNYYKHIFIDEFQDTSNFQWNNLKPLVYNSLSEEENVFIVGDVKQSIYRFRGGNLNLLLKEVEQEFVRLFGKTEVSNEILEDNWRSYKQIVTFNNLFFSRLCNIVCENLSNNFSSKIISNAYHKNKQNVKKDQNGYVEFTFLNNPGSRNKYKEEAKTLLIHNIKEVVNDGFQLKDIMILVFKNREAEEVAELLLEHNIKFVSAGSLLLSSALSVKFIIQLFKLLHTPNDPIAYSASLYLYFKLRNKKIHIEHAIFTDFNREKPILKNEFPNEFFDRIHELQRLSVFELVEELCRIFNIDLIKDAYLQFFANICLKQASKGIVTIFDFLEFWNENKEKLFINTPENLDAINIITVHKAKGLEKPIVFLPFVSNSGNKSLFFWTNDLPAEFQKFGFLPIPKNSSLENSGFSSAYFKEMLLTYLDDINKLYVAFTRPKCRLYAYVAASKDINEFKQAIPNWIIHVLKADSKLSKYFNTDNNTFILGTKSPNIIKTNKGIEGNVFNSNSRSYSNFINIRSEAKEKFALLDTSIETSIAEGIKAHSVLEKLYKKNDLDKVLSMLLSEGVLTPNDIPYLRKSINKLFENELFASWFADNDYKVLAERELFEGNKRIHKPDRVLIKGKKAIVIDYKKLVEDEKYIFQIKRYAKILLKMGFQNVDKYLVYVDTGVIKKIA